MTPTLPRLAHESRVERRRAIKRVLSAHARVQMSERIDGCLCGWRVPPFLVNGLDAYNGHLAERIESAGA